MWTKTCPWNQCEIPSWRSSYQNVTRHYFTSLNSLRKSENSTFNFDLSVIVWGFSVFFCPCAGVGMPPELDHMDYRWVCPVKGIYWSGLGEKDSLLIPVSAFRLHHLESKVIEDMRKTPDIICELKSQVESFKRKLEVCHSQTVAH